MTRNATEISTIDYTFRFHLSFFSTYGVFNVAMEWFERHRKFHKEINAWKLIRNCTYITLILLIL